MAVYTKKSTRAKPVLAVAGVKYRSGRFLRVGRAFFAPGNGDLGRMATANLILITRQPRWSPIAAGGIGVTFLPLECRSGSLRADSYLCATPEARDGLQTKRKTEERERIEKGNCSTCVHPLTVQYMLSPPVRILEILQRVNTGMRMQALLYSSPPADFSSFFVFFATYSLASFIPLQHSTSVSYFLPHRRHSLLRSLLFAISFSSRRDYTRRQTRRWFICRSQQGRT